MNIIVIGQALM